MFRCIEEIHPRWIVAENVRGIINWGRGILFNQVCANMESEGYTVSSYLLPACGVNAPHRRERIFIIAHADGDGHERKNVTGQIGSKEVESKSQQKKRQRIWNDTWGNDAKELVTDSESSGLQGKNGTCLPKSNKSSEYITYNAKSIGMEGSGTDRQQIASTQCTEKIFGCNYATVDWSKFPTQSPFCGRDDGISERLHGITFPKWRNESLKALGNAVVPQLIYEIFKVIEGINDKFIPEH
jgi:DNA (cytosine-5)-methyltransferase 1